MNQVTTLRLRVPARGDLLVDRMVSEFLSLDQSHIDVLDQQCYIDHARGELRPVLPPLHRTASICFFGRDPGQDEVKAGVPFIGDAGQALRGRLAEFIEPSKQYTVDLGLSIGKRFFWMNTVPFKPKGNQPWKIAVRRAFQPALAEMLVAEWEGFEVITLGAEAFHWFGLNQAIESRNRLTEFWKRSDKYCSSIDVQLETPTGKRTYILHPLPHPSPRNATWTKKFPELLKARLVELHPEWHSVKVKPL